ncbi:tetratricopeptide repeat protein [Pseudoxanthomonas gei]|uniref:Tetratricopeptide repeat protein n=1 Tax=Pseudoxanthomonas gei TaxID=1383030 RepID=A0ABX0AHA3_9GAMM|nr:tetratricopeptide repeat protein [Pseudoxanthomonas gei]NDK40278.1 tetratricopeptide repeat protein [Pseudoxanthomonas gei]
MISWVLAAALALPGAGAEVAPPPDPVTLMVVPAELRARMQAQVIEPARGEHQRLQRLLRFLSDDEPGLAMLYNDEATQSVAEAYLNRQANCVTYTMLFLALAQQAGLDAYPQEIEETLAWQQRDGIVYRTNHVNAGVRIGTHRYTVDVGIGFVIARHPAHRISMRRLLAQYYNNHAAMLMSERQMAPALAHAQVALELDPAYPITWSNTGVIRLHDGDPEGARRDYETALRLDPDNAAALFNLVGLYQRSGNRELEQSYRRRLDKVQQADPFHQFLMAAEYERQGNATLAIRHYQRAIRLYGDEHRFYYGLARAFILGGNQRRASRALERALELSHDDATRNLYREKMAELSGQVSR